MITPTVRAALLPLAAACALATVPPGHAVAQDETSYAVDDAVRSHVSDAVASLAERDSERIEELRRGLSAFDVTSYDVTACLDPASSHLSGVCRITIESESDHARLVLNAGLRVLSVVDGRGDSLAHSRLGEALIVRATQGMRGFPSEIEVSYEGSIEPSADAWVTGNFIALGPRSHWYPTTERRDPARLRVEARYPSGYSSVVSGSLAGMAASRADEERCPDGDVWEVPTEVPGAAVVVGPLESSLTVAGGVFFGYHVLSEEDSEWRGTPGSVPQELLDLLRFLETCNGRYPYEWLNVVRLPGDPGRPVGVMAAPGMVVVTAPGGPGAETHEILGGVVAGLTRSWWTYWIDAGPALSSGLAGSSEASWMEATGDADGAQRLRGRTRSRLLTALRNAGRDVSLAECMGAAPAADVKICSARSTALLEMLQSVIGGDAYCAALKSIAGEHGGEPVGFGDFVAAFELASSRDLDWFFYEWGARGDLPSYVFDYEVTPNEDGSYTVSGMIHQEGEPFRTPLPLTVDLGGWAYDETIDIESANQNFEIRTDSKPMRLVIDERGLVPKVNRAEVARSRYDLGTRAARSGDLGRAVDELGAAAALEPDNAAYALGYARALVRYGLSREGLTAMDSAVELDPGNAGLLLEAAELHMRSGDFAGALSLLTTCVELKPSDAAAHALRARALVELSMLDEGAAELSVAENLQGNEPDQRVGELTLLATGRLLEQRGERGAAARAYEAALAVNPVSDEARRLLRALQPTPRQ